MKKLLAIIMAMALCVSMMTQIHHHTLAGETCPILADILLHADCADHDCSDHSQSEPCNGCGFDVEALPESILKANVPAFGRSLVDNPHTHTYLLTCLCGILTGHFHFDAGQPETLIPDDIRIGQTNPFHRHLKRRGPPEIDC